MATTHNGKKIACGDVVPGCKWTGTAPTGDELVQKVLEHAAHAHGVTDVSAEMAAILCHEEERVVARDNTVCLERQVLQIAAQPGRRSCVGLHVLVRRHLDGHYTICRGAQRLGQFRADGRPMDPAAAMDAKTAPTAAWKTPRPRSPQRPQATL